MRALYRGVAAASGASVIVDSTKHLSTALLLRRIPGIDLRVVHLVRDSRGVAFSWTKRVPKPWIAGGDAYMDRYAPTRTSFRWLGYNAGFHALRAAGTRMIRMRYEDLVTEPEAQLRRAVALAGLAVSSVPLHPRANAGSERWSHDRRATPCGSGRVPWSSVRTKGGARVSRIGSERS